MIVRLDQLKSSACNALYSDITVCFSSRCHDDVMCRTDGLVGELDAFGSHKVGSIYSGYLQCKTEISGVFTST